MIPVRRLNHAVLYIRDVDRSVAFYREAFGFEVVEELPGRAAFLRAAGSENHHELGLLALGLSMPCASDIREWPIAVRIRGVND